MSLFNYAPTVRFVSLMPEVTQLMPIVRSAEARPKWLRKALDDYKNLRSDPQYVMQPNLHITRCPGIFNLYRSGWVMRTWQDMTIKTNGDGESFEWRTPINQAALSVETGEMGGYHPHHQLLRYTGDYPDSLRNILKVHTPWRCIVPDGYYLLEMAVPYGDDKRFTTLMGVYDRENGVAPMNVQFLWHCLNSEELIPAGTPIAYYLLVPKDQVDFTVEDADDEFRMKDKLTKLAKGCAFHGTLRDIKERIRKALG